MTSQQEAHCSRSRPLGATWALLPCRLILRYKNKTSEKQTNKQHENWMTRALGQLAASEAALHISYTGRISSRLTTASVVIRPQCLARLQPQCFVTLEFIATRSARVLSRKKEASYSQFHSFWKWYYWEVCQQFWVQKRSNHYRLILFVAT